MDVRDLFIDRGHQEDREESSDVMQVLVRMHTGSGIDVPVVSCTSGSGDRLQKETDGMERKEFTEEQTIGVLKEAASAVSEHRHHFARLV